jgi:hypothetical protein
MILSTKFRRDLNWFEDTISTQTTSSSESVSDNEEHTERATKANSDSEDISEKDPNSDSQSTSGSIELSGEGDQSVIPCGIINAGTFLVFWAGFCAEISISI